MWRSVLPIVSQIIFIHTLILRTKETDSRVRTDFWIQNSTFVVALKKNKTPDFLTLFPDFISIFETFSRSGKLLGKLPGIFQEFKTLYEPWDRVQPS